MNKWDLGGSCADKFRVGDKVETRGDLGGFKLFVRIIHNDFYCACSRWRRHGRLRHFNMNVLEKRS